MKVSKIEKEEKVRFDEYGNAVILNTIEVETPMECGDDLAALVSAEYRKDTIACKGGLWSPIYDGDYYRYETWENADGISTIVTVFFKKEAENEEEITK